MNTLSLILNNLRRRMPVGSIQMYAGTTAPSDWLPCDGSEYLKTDYPKLYATIGNTYGVLVPPSDSDHFRVPDMRGRVPVGVGESTATGHTAHTLGQMEGNENAIIVHHRHTYYMSPAYTDAYTLQTSDIPAHTHGNKSLTGGWYASGVANATVGTYGIVGHWATSNGAYTGNGANNRAIAQITIDASHEHDSVGGGGAHKHSITAASENTGYAGDSGAEAGANMMPYLGVNYIIYAGK